MADKRSPGRRIPAKVEPPRPINENLVKTVIAIPLLKQLNDEAEARKQAKGPKRKSVRSPQPALYDVVIDLHLEYPGGREAARTWVVGTITQLIGQSQTNQEQNINKDKSSFTAQYVFARLKGDVILQLVKLDTEDKPELKVKEGTRRAYRAIYQIWPDFEVEALISTSVRTVKADAARAAFSAMGDGIVWAVLDSGIQGDHPHFTKHQNLQLQPPIEPIDFTGQGSALTDEYGHGTHVAGIIAGEIPPLPVLPGAAAPEEHPDIIAYNRRLQPEGMGGGQEITYDKLRLASITGMAPKCKLVSMKVLDSKGRGQVSSLIAALAKIQEINGHGRFLRIHGVNMSVGYGFDPEWFACGQSPLCVEVDRLVRSGVVVVVAAGNTGYGVLSTAFLGARSSGLSLTINDPGNAEQAITVGSTHRDMPHVYGVSYFSSKGPTGDGRIKPDLIAPGEKIVSCAAGQFKEDIKAKVDVDCTYLEYSGTSMAAPHVSGVIASFLSVRREFIGQAQKVKEIFLSSATDLKRERYFQGHGLVDLMRAIQSV